jgi:hypothetical protein
MNARTLSLITGLVAGLAMAPSALAVSGCTNSYLSGNYAMQFSGTAAPAVATGIGGVAVPASMSLAFQQNAAAGSSGGASIAGAARLTLDGNGNITGYSSENMAGQWLQGNVTGTYTVNTDCTFSLALTDSSGNSENFGGVLVGSKARSAVVLQTDAGSGVSGTLKSVRGFCQTSDLLGAFGLQYAGTSLTLNSPYSSVGVVSLDGQGNLTAAESRFSSGFTSQVQSIGTMTINPDCSFAMVLSSVSATGGAMNFFGIVSGANENQLLIVESDAATAVTGTMTSQ